MLAASTAKKPESNSRGADSGPERCPTITRFRYKEKEKRKKKKEKKKAVSEDILSFLRVSPSLCILMRTGEKGWVHHFPHSIS